MKRTAMTHTPKGLFATFLFLPHFDLGDLSPNMLTHGNMDYYFPLLF